MTNSPEFANGDEARVGFEPSAVSSDADAPEAAAAQSSEAEDRGDGWSGADIEEAYLKALQAMEGVPWEQKPPVDGGTEAPAEPLGVAAGEQHEAPSTEAQTAPESAAAVPEARPPAPAPRIAAGTEPTPQTLVEESNVTPAQVIEAALFVGGGALTARKISALLRSSTDTASVERIIDELNSAYAAQGRPYEIRLGDGGYRLELRPEYDKLRHRVYGSGPREIRLSQDVLEVLALVAYRQPISQQEIEGHGKQNAGNLLRQLLRRDLIAFERGAGGRKDLSYHTTPRFLSVFGLASIDELPEPEDLARK